MAQKSADESKTFEMYSKLKEKSVASYCKLVLRHPHFNYRLNII